MRAIAYTQRPAVGQLAHSLEEQLLPDRMEQWIIAPDIRPLIERVLPLRVGALREGIAHVRSHRAVGKVVLRIDPGSRPRDGLVPQADR